MMYNGIWFELVMSGVDALWASKNGLEKFFPSSFCGLSASVCSRRVTAVMPMFDLLRVS